MTVSATVVVVVGLLVGVRPRHVISRQRREVTSRAVHVVVVRMMSGVAAVVVGRGSESLTLNLISRLCKNRDIAISVVIVNSRVRESKS